MHKGLGGRKGALKLMNGYRTLGSWTKGNGRTSMDAKLNLFKEAWKLITNMTHEEIKIYRCKRLAASHRHCEISPGVCAPG
ncbi:hypothetical protein Nepgr_016950 [Nepenthes gracilis]|uniref:Uncharacterized protein n=1 Tax=Nepenthes gracilis TaxID=150966 RepID=A0AAD3SQN1_NEPGR|nr:hypothetical protein Nepgr_016950 [Nepenthes gracilis]